MIAAISSTLELDVGLIGDAGDGLLLDGEVWGCGIVGDG
jgi:hypothetical protein